MNGPTQFIAAEWLWPLVIESGRMRRQVDVKGGRRRCGGPAAGMKLQGAAGGYPGQGEGAHRRIAVNAETLA